MRRRLYYLIIASILCVSVMLMSANARENPFFPPIPLYGVHHVRIDSAPIEGPDFIKVDGKLYGTPFTRYWLPGTEHTIEAISTVTVAGKKYDWLCWRGAVTDRSIDGTWGTWGQIHTLKTPSYGDIITSIYASDPIGDVNGDGKVNADDLAMVQAHYGAWAYEGHAGPNYVAGCDINQDSIIDIWDMAIVQEHIA